jgi:hypothetical protein
MMGASAELLVFWQEQAASANGKKQMLVFFKIGWFGGGLCNGVEGFLLKGCFTFLHDISIKTLQYWACRRSGIRSTNVRF